MRQLKKKLSLTLIVTFILSIVRVQTNVQAVELNIVPAQPLKPATFSGVDAQLSDKLKTLPSSVTYNTKLMDIPELMGKEINIESSSNTTFEAAKPSGGLTVKPSRFVNGLSEQKPAIDISKIDAKDLKYPVGANFMVLDKNDSSFTPAPGEIYIDKTSNSAMKVLDTPIFDAKSGKNVIPVVKPQFSEIFKSYKIPEQTVRLNKANVGYVRPTAKDEDGESYIKIEQAQNKPNIILPRKPILGATHIADTAGLGPVDVQDDALVVTIKNLTIYEYPEPKKEDEEEKKKNEKKAGSEDYNPDEEGEPGYYESKDGTQPKKEEKKEGDKSGNLSSDLKGNEESGSLSVKVKIEDAKLTIHKPEAFANVDIGFFEQKIEVGYQSEVESEINLKGELKFDKVIEVCIFGYDIEIPYGRAFIGVFLVLDAKGEVTVKSKIVTNSLFKAGLKAQAYVFVPVYVGPFAEPEIKSINAGFSADGEIKAKAAIVPQVGLEICDLEIGVLQLWLALTADAKFHLEGSVGASVDTLSAEGDIKGEGSLKLGAYAEFVGYLFGGRYSLFYKDWTLYEGSWAIGQEVKAAEGDARRIPGTVSLAADAFDNSIQGIVTYYDKNGDASVGGGNLPRGTNFVIGTPLKNERVDIYIQHKNGVTEQPIIVNTDNFGCFEVPKEQRKNITPNDIVYAKVNTTIKDSSGEVRKVFEKSSNVVPTIPFDEIHFVADAFNDVVSGTVSGKYVSENNEKYNGYVQVQEISKTGIKSTPVNVKVDDGVFSYDLDLVGGEAVKVTLPFEGVNFPLDAEPKEASLDALKIRFKKPSSGVGLSEVEGTVQNVAKDMYKSYRGDVKVKTTITPYDEIGSGKVTPGTSRMMMPDKNSPLGASMTTIDTGTSTFKMPITPSVRFTINIEHDGIIKKVMYDPLGELYNKLKNIELEKQVTNPVEDKTNPVVNPADNWKGIWEFDQLGTVVLDVDGINVTGSYNAGECILKAQAMGDKLVGTLYEYGEEYKVEFYMPQDGKTFRGTWFNEGKGNNFKGVKLNTPFSLKTVTDVNLKSFTGIWYSDYGTILFNQDGAKLAGTYDSNKYSISGTVSGRMFKGNFIEGASRGEIELELLPDGLTFEGQYRYDGDEEWSPWNGTRHVKSLKLNN